MTLISPSSRIVFAMAVHAIAVMTRAAEAPTHPVLAPGAYTLYPGLELSLFAQEPDVVDPVALTFDEHGRMYVVEMRDYPSGMGAGTKPGGTIRLLEDVNRDGRADRSVVFAGELSFPTSIAPWSGGVVVTAPPEILFLKDTDGDGRADVREVLYHGFQLGVTDSNVNGLRWGLDNWLHGVNGGNDGSIVSRRQPGPAVSIRGVDFSFRPASGEFVPTFHTSGGFGLVFDDWGRSFVTYNINHIQQRIIPVRYLQRFPGLPPVEATASISDHEEMARIFPLSEPETRPNHPEQSGRFSAAGGLSFLGSQDWLGGFDSLFVCDVVGHVVHRDVLIGNSPNFQATRSPSEQTNEFFAARDRAFRPVGLELGPDGALYLIDMQRDVIEHPDYIPKKVLAGLDLRAGADRGRIYRITPQTKSTRRPGPGGIFAAELSSRELVEGLADENSWWRCTAQRLLVERRDRSAVPALRTLARDGNPHGRLHALWTLQGLEALDERMVVTALGDTIAAMRENALLLAESFLPGSREVTEGVVARAQDNSARVRFQAALTLGQIDDVSAVAALRVVFEQDASNRWTRLAVLSSLRRGEGDWLAGWLQNAKRSREGDEANSAEVARELAEFCGARVRGTNGLGAVLSALVSNRVEVASRLAVLEGLTEGLRRAPGPVTADGASSNAVAQLLADRSPGILEAAWRLATALGLPEGETQRAALERAKGRAADTAIPLAERVGQVRLLSMGSYAAVGEVLLQRLTGSEPAEIQAAAVSALRRYSDAALAERLVARWRSLAPSIRGQVLGLLLQRASFHAALVGALESGRLTLGELNLDLEQRRRLLRRSSPEIMARAGRLMGDEEYSQRREIVAEWMAKLPATGNPTTGRPVFERLCVQCHALGGGASAGPDLAAVAHRSVEDLVSNILDPNMAINPNYVTYTAETLEGESQTGVMVSESAGAVVLMQAMGRRVVLPRATLRSLESTGVSLMPEGLEVGLTPPELRDLIAYLQVTR